MMRPQDMEGETSEPTLKPLWGKNSHISSQAEVLQSQSNKEKENLAEIFFDTKQKLLVLKANSKICCDSYLQNIPGPGNKSSYY